MTAREYERIGAAIERLEKELNATTQKENERNHQGQNAATLRYIQQQVEDIRAVYNMGLEPDTQEETPEEIPQGITCKRCIHIQKSEPFRHRGSGKLMSFYTCKKRRRNITMAHGGHQALTCKYYQEKRQCTHSQ
jgi:hypothetical protein